MEKSDPGNPGIGLCVMDLVFSAILLFLRVQLNIHLCHKTEMDSVGA